jgi:hypothetical protein
MDFDARLRDKLIGILRAELPKIKLRDSGRLDIQSMFDMDKAFTEVLRHAPKLLKEQVEAYVGERPLFSLMYGMLTDELTLLAPEVKAEKGRLCELPLYGDVEALAQRIFSMLTKLPNQYVAVVELPRGISEEMYRNNAPPILGQKLAVIGSWQGEQDGYPFPTPVTLVRPPQNAFMGLLGLKPPSATLTALQQLPVNAQSAPVSHLYVKLEGYINSVSSQQPLNLFTTIFKAFFGLALGMEVLESDWKSFGGSQLLISVYQNSDAGFFKIEDDTVGDSESALVRKIIVSDLGREHLMKNLRTIVNILDMNEQLPQLVLAGRWLFDSSSNGDALMGFMQLAICAEVLLGNEDGGESVTAMLANRCAYLIASSTKERDDLTTEFKNIYKVRSKIVHRGHGILKENERNQFRRLRTICNRVLQREIQLAIMDSPQYQQEIKMANALRSYP